MGLIRNRWNLLSNTGVNSGHGFDLKGSIRISNQTALVSSILGLGYLIYGIVFLNEANGVERSLFYVFHVIFALVFVPVLLFNKYGFHKTASLFILILATILIIANSWSLKQPFRTEPYFFIIAAFSFVVLRKWVIILPLYLVQMVGYYIVSLRTLQTMPEMHGGIDGLLLRVILYFSFLFLLLLFLKNESDNYRSLLERRSLQLSQEKEGMEKLNFTKDKIFSIISHDLRSPIGSLKGLLSLLKDDNLTIEEFKKATSGLESQVDLLHKSLGEMLIWSKAQLTGVNPDPTNVKLRDVAQEVVRINKLAARQKKIILVCRVLHETTAYCDHEMLKSVIMNLLTNALKFTPTGGAVTVYEENSADNIKLIVEDTGVGIAPEDIEKILSPSTHFTTYGTNNEKGTGLGMIMCKEFVEKNNGELSISSKKGRGTKFTITLPRNGEIA
jgi:signal transduction histidine kinase